MAKKNEEPVQLKLKSPRAPADVGIHERGVAVAMEVKKLNVHLSALEFLVVSLHAQPCSGLHWHAQAFKEGISRCDTEGLPGNRSVFDSSTE